MDSEFENRTRTSCPGSFRRRLEGSSREISPAMKMCCNTTKEIGEEERDQEDEDKKEEERKQEEVGMFARRVGNILQAFSGVPRVASIMEMDSCFAEIPVWVDESVQFIDVKPLVLKVHGVQEPCSDLLPLTVQPVESWVEINRHVTAVKSPPMVKRREGEISEAPISELYSSRTLKQWENNLQYPYF